jgi:hypothetical protein
MGLKNRIEGIDWMYLSQERNKWRVLVSMVGYSQVP